MSLQETPIAQADYELSRDEVEAFMLQQRERSLTAIRALTRTGRRIRTGAYIGAAVVMALDLLLTGTLTAITTLAIVLIIVGQIAQLMMRRKVESTGGGEAQPKWVIRRIVRKQIFGGRAHLRGAARFYRDRVVIDQGDSHFESGYDEYIDLIVLSPGYLQITPAALAELPDTIYCIPLAAIAEREPLIAWLQRQDRFIVA